MKVIVSSKTLYEELQKVDNIQQAEIHQNGLKLISLGNEVFISAETRGVSNPLSLSFDQGRVRWDWIKKDLKMLSERPLVLDIDDHKFNIILSY